MRLVVGVSISSGWEGVDAAVLQVNGIGLELHPRLLASVRAPFPLSLRDWCLRARLEASDGARLARLGEGVGVAEVATQALRQTLTQAGVGVRDLFVCGLLEPAIGSAWVDWAEMAARLAEQTGCSVVHSMPQRDRAAGGSGRLLTALADFLLFRHLPLPRVLLHVGHVTSLLYLPRHGSLKQLFGFEVGPGNHWLDSLIYHGTRGRECCDHGGKRAVQGHHYESLSTRWNEHPYLSRRPPKTIPPEAFGRAFLLSAFGAAQSLRITLSDLLCTATWWIARSVAEAVRQWLPADALTHPLLVSGGGIRNGFLWQLLAQHFPVGLQRTDAAGIPPLARQAAAAAILATLTCDGVAGQSPFLTGAQGGRWLGSFCPGDPRHWSRLSAWVAEQTKDLALLRAA
ncbi:MAG: anhydro-N-acetylmuramic acid kinase [Gemmataceae bacterium]|jgi:anhydro-N-acetylmuramic acid kinase|nr:MAG: anhydro-N-acetylmuramic acid kinase [Gemmataceae bacterium]